MNNMAKALTTVAVRNAKPGIARREIPDGGCRGLYLVVQSSGAKSWAVRYRHDGKPRKFTLGDALAEACEADPDSPAVDGAALTLAGARKLAADVLHQVQQGRDPASAKVRTGETMRRAAAMVADTFETIAHEYFRREGSKLRSAPQQISALTRLVFPVIGDRQIANIRRSEIVHLLDAIEDGRGPVMADRTLAYVGKIMNWYASRTDDFRSPVVPA